jgi:HlyD family secretion protein
VKTADITSTVTATGQLTAVVNVQVGSQISGNIKKLYADFNTRVKAGQVVAELDPATFEAAVMQSEGELAAAKAALELAELDAKRSSELFARKLVAPSEHDKAMVDLHSAQATVKIREASLERMKIDLARCKIYAPVDGIVISRNVDVGQTVAAAMTAPVLFTIANDLSKMNIEANVSEADIGTVLEGLSATFTVDAFPDRLFHGKVTQVRYAPVTVENVVTYVTVIEVSNPKLELRPGMTANVSIVTAERKGVLGVPNAALRFRPPQETGTDTRKAGAPGSALPGGTGAKTPLVPRRKVYVLDGDTPKAVDVTLGITDNVTTELLGGLKEGDTVVTGLISGAKSGALPAMSPFGGPPGPPRR